MESSTLKRAFFCVLLVAIVFGFVHLGLGGGSGVVYKMEGSQQAAVSDSAWSLFYCDVKSFLGFPCPSEEPASTPIVNSKPIEPVVINRPAGSQATTTTIVQNVVNEYVSNPVERETVREVLIRDVVFDVSRFITRQEYDAQVDGIMRSIEEDSGGGGSSGISDITGESIEDLADVASMTKIVGDLFTWTGSAWTNIATSSLGITGSGAVDSVNGQAGVVALDTSDISESGNLYFTTARARETISSTVTGISYATSTGILSLTAGYNIPQSASTTNWNGFYDVPSTRITGGDALTWSGNTLNFDGGAIPAGELGGTWALPTVNAEITSLEELSDVDTFTQATGNVLYWTGSGWNVTATSTWDTNTTYTAGDHLTLTGNDFDVDDDFLFNTGDTISGNLVMGGTAANLALGSNYLSGDGDDEGVFVSSAGLVGIGTTTPSEALTVVGGISSAGEGVANEVYGLGATLVSGPGNGNTLVGAYTEMAAAGFGQYNTIVGAYSSSSNAYNTIVGSRSSATGGTSVLIGESLSSSVTFSTVIGANSSVTGTGLLAMGYSAQASHNNAVAIGWGVASAEDFEYVFGSRAVASTSPSIRLAGSTNQYTGQDLFELDTAWIDSTDGTRKSRATLSVFDTAERTFMQADATGSSVITSFNGGNIGIGTTTPTSLLAIQTTGTTDILNLFETGGSEVLTVLESGFVGIGQSTPLHMLHLKNNALTYAGVAIEGGQVGDASWTLLSGYPAAGDFSIRESGVQTSLTIKKTTGNIGIGTTTPVSLFSMSGLDPIITLTDTNLAGSSWQIRNGFRGDGDLDFYNIQDDKTMLYIDNDDMILIGTSTNYVGNASRLFVYGGSNGANVDVMGEAVIGRDQAVIDLQSSDWATSASSIFMRMQGPANAALGTVMGFPVSHLAELSFTNPSAAIIRVSATTSPLIIATNDVERMRITGTGEVGIGTTTPAHMLTVVGNIYAERTGAAAGFTGNRTDGTTFSLQAASTASRFNFADSGDFAVSNNTLSNILNNTSAAAGNDFIFAQSSTGNLFLVSEGSGNVGVATTTPGRKLTVVGTVEFRGLTAAVGAGSLCLSASNEVVYNSGSDNCLSSTENTKHAITPLTLDAINILNELEPVSFIYNGTDRVRYGFIAERTASVDDILATYNADGDLTGIDDRSILSVLVRAFQEFYRDVMDRFTAQDSRIEALEDRISELEAREGIDSDDSGDEEPSEPVDLCLNLPDTQVEIPSGYSVDPDTGDCVEDESVSNDGEGTPPPPAPILGCMDSEALNFNPEATEDDDSCDYEEPALSEVEGEVVVDETGEGE